MRLAPPAQALQGPPRSAVGLMAAPAPPLPCDFCRAPVAPFGFAPPPDSGIAVRRPIKTCSACREKGEERLRALLAAKDPFAAARLREDPPAPAQGVLL